MRPRQTRPARTQRAEELASSIDTLALLTPASRKPNDWRDNVLILMVALGAAVAVITELLSTLHAIRPVPVTVVWIVLGVLSGAWLIRRERAGPKHIWSVTGVDALLLAGVSVIAGVVLFIALRSAPNSTDAMGYHLPRVVYWAQAGSVAFFPVHYYAQLTMPPLAEYFVLQTFVVSGGDHFANLVQFFGFIGSMLAVSLIARELGAHVRGQTIAVVLCATLPNAILQASGVKNDLLMSFWLAAMVFYALRGNALGTGVSLSLAFATKGTAYVFGLPLLLAAVAFLPLRRLLQAGVIIAACVLAVNGPQYWRNYFLSGSVLGFPSAAVDQLPQFRNERLSPGVTFSNVLRGLSEQLGTRSERWNRAVYNFVVRAHEMLGLDVNDPASTFLWTNTGRRATQITKRMPTINGICCSSSSPVYSQSGSWNTISVDAGGSCMPRSWSRL